MDPIRWLTDHATWIPQAGTALDVACGHGRHAIWLVRHGLSVTAVDRDDVALGRLGQAVADQSLDLEILQEDLESGPAAVWARTFDVIVVVHYLHRPLFGSLIDALRPGGLLVYETFTREQARLGKPTNPDYLLTPGELPRLVHPLEVLASREGFFDGRHVASVVARRPSTVLLK